VKFSIPSFVLPALLFASITANSQSLPQRDSTNLAPKAAPAATPPASGYWHTSGNQILDTNNNPVRIAALNWWGLESTQAVPGGLNVQDYHAILATIKSDGYNAIRVPFSNQMVETPFVPGGISFSNATGPINTDLAGLTSLQILDKIVSAAGTLGLRIILDNHRSEAGATAEAGGLWYTTAYPESSWLYDWTMLAQRYLGNPTVVGMDLRNEPHVFGPGGVDGSCWGCGTLAHDWRLAAERGGNAVLAVNPSLLIFVEGSSCFGSQCDWWGGSLAGAQTYPVNLNVANRLVYSPHDYGPNLYPQPWFTSATTPASLQAIWMTNWAYLSVNNIAPIWLGEFGTTNSNADIQSSTPGSQGQWFQSLIAFLKANPAMSWGYWAVNGNDNYALLDGNFDATPANPLKQQLLASIQPVPAAVPAFTLSVPSTKLTLTPGQTVKETVILKDTGGFNGRVAFTVSGLPAGVTASFSANPSASYTVLSLTASATATGSSTSITVTGTSGSLTASASIPVTVSAPAAPFTCHVAYTVTGQWPGGFGAAITLYNTSTTPISAWTLTWTFANGQTISQLWSGIATQNGPAVTVSSESYNGSIPAGGSLTGMGFNGVWNNSTNTAPTAFAINGTPCN
jgi:endoglucanase